MQKPFTLTDAMAKELEDAAATQVIEASHDPIGDWTGAKGLRRRPNNGGNIGGTPSLPENSMAMDNAPAEDPINPAHYRRHPSGIECIEVTRHMNFNVGNAIKYLWRYMDKGDPIENLKKAQWYLDDEIRRLGGQR